MSIRITLCVLVTCLVALGQAKPPKTDVKPVTDRLHGKELVDPYRWLEGSDAPEVKGKNAALDAAVADWTDAQNAYTRGILDRLPGRKKLEQRMRELLEVGSVGAPRMAGNRYFYTRRDGKQAQSVLYVREGLGGEPRVLIDPNTLDEDGLITLAWSVPDPKGELLAFGTYRSGDENSTLHLLDVASGEWLADVIPGKVRGVYWLPDSSGFFYRRLRDVNDPYSGQIKFHEVGRHERQDRLLFEQYREGPLATTWGPSAWVSPDARWMLLFYWTSTKDNDLWVVDLDHWFRTGEFVKREILTGGVAMNDGEVIGDTLFLFTNLEAPNGRVLSVDLNDPRRERWKEIIPEREDAVLTGISMARGTIVGRYLKDASTRIELFAHDGTSRGELELPGIGTAGLSTSRSRSEAFLTFSSFNEPSSIYHVDLASGERKLWARPDVPVDPASVVVKQVWYPSKDGTKVSMFLVHEKGLELDGSNPTILYGYGGFNISITPRFTSTLFPWFEGGGVYAVANLRGGGEYGRAWHEAGRLGEKQNVFDDFHAAAEWLIENKYTDRDHLGAYGGSNGGLLTGAAVTQRPDLFSCAISAVPLLDMVRYQHFLMARYWVPEYGSAENPEQFDFIRKYSPYHNIKKGVKYPSVLFTAGENDTRVHPLHARKMAAAMQAATASDPKTEPILLWVEREAGHGGGKPLHIRVREVTDLRHYMMWQLGMISPAD